MPINGLFKAKATACAALKPTSSAMASPGPCVAATAVQRGRGNPGFAQGGVRDGQEILEMFAGGEFRHHAAVFLMQFDLRGNHVGQDDPVAHHGGAGFIAGSFEREEGHGRQGKGRNDE